jgi:hypothetical protein
VEEREMAKQGDLGLLDDEVAKELLGSRIPARFAYVWNDGTPRVVPIWFHWDGTEFVLGTPPHAPKMKALPANRRVALTIDSETMPYHVLMVRGTASLQVVEGITPEYAASARRYMGDDQGDAWVRQVASLSPTMARVAIRPDWVGILDFQTRFPSALG